MAEKATSGVFNMKFIGGIVAAGIIIAIASVVLGRSGGGQIDVSAAISDANKAAEESGGEKAPNPTKQQGSNLPNGGLVGTGKAKQEVPAPKVEGTSTTSADTAASSTNENGGENDAAASSSETSSE